MSTIEKTREERLDALRGRAWTVSLGFGGNAILHGREVVAYYESIRAGEPRIDVLNGTLGSIGPLNGSTD